MTFFFPQNNFSFLSIVFIYYRSLQLTYQNVQTFLSEIQHIISKMTFNNNTNKKIQMSIFFKK